MFATNPVHALEEEVLRLSKSIAEEKRQLDEIITLFKDSQIYSVGDLGGSVETYKYFIYPFKGLTLVNQKIYATAGKYLARLVPKDTEVILTIESDGIGLASFVGAELGLPVVICKSFHYNVPSLEFVQKTGYYERTMYLPKVIEGKKVAIVDCLISTGGTVLAMIEAIKKLADTKITGIYCLNNKSNYNKQQKTIEDYNYGYLFDTRIVEEENRVEAQFSKYLRTAFWQSIDALFFDLAKQYSQLSNFSTRGYQVGALIVAADTFEIVAWGYRRGNIHAEQDAITMLKSNCPDWEQRDFSLYTTMEPCAYRNGSGYTCCSELINQVPQIRWVVIGEIDTTDEQINGAGLERLKNCKHIRMIQNNEVIRSVNPVPHFSTQTGI